MTTNHKLLSICIPTYNRADCLRRLLDIIIPQILESKEGVEVCISNNGSLDNTHEVVNNFKEQYPDLIKYNENKENLGFDRNVLKAVDMAAGEFVWTFSDDDLIVNNGIAEVTRFILENKDNEIGGMVVKFSSYTKDPESGKQIKYTTSLDENKPEMYGGLSCLEMLQDDNAYQGMCELIYNNKYLKKILNDKQDLVKKGIGTHQIHTWLFFQSFLLNREAKFYVLNKNIVISPDTNSKSSFMMDDHFELLYRGKIQLYDNLLSTIDKSEIDIIKAIRKLKRYPVLSMVYIIGLYRVFGVANFASSIRCIKLSFGYLSFAKAFFILLSLIIISTVPSCILKRLWKFSLQFNPRTKDKVEYTWMQTCVAFNTWSQGSGKERTAKETGMFLNTKP